MHAQGRPANHETRVSVVGDPPVRPPVDAKSRVVAGAGMLLLVMVLLSIPLMVAVRSARARRTSGQRASRQTVVTPDAWSESARRLGGDA